MTPIVKSMKILPAGRYKVSGADGLRARDRVVVEFDDESRIDAVIELKLTTHIAIARPI